jgi:hypothetical protein
MTEESESLVLEILKKIQNDLATVKDELKANRLWQSAVDSRFNAIDSHLASMHLDMAQVNAIDGIPLWKRGTEGYF